MLVANDNAHKTIDILIALGLFSKNNKKQKFK